MFKKLMLATLLLPALNIYSVGNISNEQIVRVNNYPSHVKHDVSGKVLHVNRSATEQEIKLADERARYQLERESKSFFENLGSDISDNFNYLVSAKPFGIPYGFPIAGSLLVVYACYQVYKNK